jgi:hypothetical protein
MLFNKKKLEVSQSGNGAESSLCTLAKQAKSKAKLSS